MNYLLEFDTYARAQCDKHERYAERLATSNTIWAMAPSELADREMHIVVTRYEEPFSKDGKLYCFARGSLDESVAVDEVFLRLDHNPSLEFGSTKNDAVSVYSDQCGITAKVNLAKLPRAAMLAHMIEKDNRSSASIGCDILESHDVSMNGQMVRMIDKAKIRECSLVKEGAHPAAFACVVDKDVPSPSLARPSAQLNAYASLHAVKVSLDNAKHTLAAVLGDDHTPVKRTWTLAELNRAQSREIEALQRRVARVNARW